MSLIAVVIHTSIINKTTTRDEPFPTLWAPFHIAALMVNTTGHDATDITALCFITAVGNSGQVFFILIGYRGSGAGDRFWIFNIPSASFAISHKTLRYPECP